MPYRTFARTWMVAALAAGALVACEHERPPPPGKVEVIAAPAGIEIPPWVHDRIIAARDRQVIVYVGAPWCEPCKHFHDALASGQLDAAFPRLTVLEFDQDRDADHLMAAGYTSRLIPLFVRPRPDGQASGRSIEGSIKGAGAVAEITPRLRELLVN